MSRLASYILSEAPVSLRRVPHTERKRAQRDYIANKDDNIIWHFDPISRERVKMSNPTIGSELEEEPSQAVGVFNILIFIGILY